MFLFYSRIKQFWFFLVIFHSVVLISPTSKGAGKRINFFYFETNSIDYATIKMKTKILWKNVKMGEIYS